MTLNAAGEVLDRGGLPRVAARRSQDRVNHLGGQNEIDRRMGPTGLSIGDDQSVPVVPGAEMVKALFQSEYGRMVRLAQYLAADPDRGEEIAQEAFAVVMRRAATLAEPAQAGAYLRRVVINLARSAARRRRLSFRIGVPSWAVEEESAEISAVISERQAVLGALGKLSRRQRECLVLRFYLDMTEEQVAASLSVSLGAVKTHSHRGITALAQILGETP